MPLRRDLIEKAKAAARRAYCPYSRFPVGAAIGTESGTVFTICNVENSSYGRTICAERNAIFQMVAAGGETTFDVIVVDTPTPNSTAPCPFRCRSGPSAFTSQTPSF
jgi:cytidine deaminase